LPINAVSRASARLRDGVPQEFASVFLIEAHGKNLLASCGVPIPEGVFLPAGVGLSSLGRLDGPVVVKAQVTTGGRGKAGGIRVAASHEEAARIIAALGSGLNGKPIHGFRIEKQIDFVHEAYVSLSVDAEAAQIRLMVAAEGGVDVETSTAHQSILSDPEELPDAVAKACATLPTNMRAAVHQASMRLADAFIKHEATLLEINPLFILADGSWIAGDVKLVMDDNAIPRQPAIRALLEQHPDIYPEAARKLSHGFDYVEVDPLGEIGLVTTGAGLSMQLIDELRRQGHRPLNFCDIRSGQFRGDPARLIAVMRWIASRPSIKVVLVNIFAGITDLAEFAQLMVQAAREVPELRVPIIARLIGRNLDAARQVLNASGLAMTLEPELDRAVELTLAALAGTGMRHG
jgi:succinyl-CoA synthetase beta subunit